MRRIACGEAQALLELRARHDGTLYEIAYAVLEDPTDATHVVSEAFLQAVRGAMQFNPDCGCVPVWLTGMVLRRACDVLLTRTRQNAAWRVSGVGDGPGTQSTRS